MGFSDHRSSTLDPRCVRRSAHRGRQLCRRPGLQVPLVRDTDHRRRDDSGAQVRGGPARARTALRVVPRPRAARDRRGAREPDRRRRVRELVDGLRLDDQTLERVERLHLDVQLLDERHRQRAKVRKIAARDDHVDGRAVLARFRHRALHFGREKRHERIALEETRLAAAGPDRRVPRERVRVQLLAGTHDDDRDPPAIDRDPARRPFAPRGLQARERAGAAARGGSAARPP